MSTRFKPRDTGGGWPEIDLPITPPYPPMEAKRVSKIPNGAYLYEPKWDGFRAIVFRSGDAVAIQSKAGQPLGRYFPDVVEAVKALEAKKFVIDGEIVVPVDGLPSFDDLLLRIHPAASRVNKLAEATPAHLYVFDMLVEGGQRIDQLPIETRRERLEKFLDEEHERVHLSPATTERSIATGWFKQLAHLGLDGVMAKRLGEPYHSGDREGMVKVKNMKTADCVVGGFRYGEGTKTVGSMLLGLYDKEERLVYIGHTSSVKASDRAELTKKLESLRGENAFEGRVPGGPSRWSQGKSSEWEPVKPELVCEVEYDYFSQGRFRHGSKFLRWRPEKAPEQCTMDQVLPKRGTSGVAKLLKRP
jgi:ATP-dependent DNA ligase